MKDIDPIVRASVEDALGPTCRVHGEARRAVERAASVALLVRAEVYAGRTRRATASAGAGRGFPGREALELRRADARGAGS